MIGLVVESLPDETDAASDRGVERSFLPSRVRFTSGRRDAPVRAAPRIPAGRKPPSGALIAARPQLDPVRPRVSDTRPQTLKRVPPRIPLARWTGGIAVGTERW